MDDKELGVAAAIILAGIVSGEGTTNDDRATKRAIDLAYRLKKLLHERLSEKPAA